MRLFSTLILGLVLLVPTLARAQDDTVDGSPVRSADDVPSADEVRQGLRLTPLAFRAATERVRPALVTIESYGGATAIEGQIGGIRRQGEGNSTGLLISEEGYIITSTFAFLRSPPVIIVVTSDGEKRQAKIVGRDDTRKICLLKTVEPVDLPLPEIVPRDEIEIGQWAISVGVGFGDTNPAVSMGIISAKKRVGGKAVQTDANISPANYGGPLIDIEGRVIGICVPLSPRSQEVGAGVEWYDSGIGFAIPLGDFDRILEKLKAGENIRPGFLGIQMAPREDGEPGAVIQSVVEDTPAAEAGLQEGDIIIKINGEEVTDLAQLRRTIRALLEGDEVTIAYLREEEEQEVKVVLGSAPEGQ